MLGDPDARAYLNASGEEVPTLRNPREIGDYFVNDDRIGAVRQAAISLCGQGLTKVRGFYKKNVKQYNQRTQQSVRRGLKLFQDLLAHIRNMESGVDVQLGQIDAGLSQDIHGAYSMIDNWALYWGNITSYSMGAQGDYDTSQEGPFGGGEPATQHHDPRNRDMVMFKGPTSSMHPEEVGELHLAMSSLANALKGLEDLFDPQVSIAGNEDWTLRAAFSEVLKGLMPILGIETIKSGLSKALA